MIFDKKTMKEVNTYKTSFFVITLFLIFAIESSLSFLWLQITDKASLTLSSFLTVIFVREFIFILFDLLLGSILFLTFYIKENIKISTLIFKTIISMNFIRLLISFITFFLQLSFFLDLLMIVYNFFFIVTYMKVNIELELSENILKKYIVISFILTFVLIAFIIRFGLSIIGSII